MFHRNRCTQTGSTWFWLCFYFAACIVIWKLETWELWPVTCRSDGVRRYNALLSRTSHWTDQNPVKQLHQILQMTQFPFYSKANIRFQFPRGNLPLEYDADASASPQPLMSSFSNTDMMRLDEHPRNPSEFRLQQHRNTHMDSSIHTQKQVHLTSEIWIWFGFLSHLYRLCISCILAFQISENRWATKQVKPWLLFMKFILLWMKCFQKQDFKTTPYWHSDANLVSGESEDLSAPLQYTFSRVTEQWREDGENSKKSFYLAMFKCWSVSISQLLFNDHIRSTL